MKRKLLLLILATMLAFSGCGNSGKEKIGNEASQENKTPEEILSEKVLGEWNLTEMQLNFWLSKDGTGIVTEGKEEYDITWKIVKTNEFRFSTKYDDDAFTIDEIDDSTMAVTWNNHKYTMSRTDKSVSVKVDGEEILSQDELPAETNTSFELAEETRKIVGLWNNVLYLLPDGTAFCINDGTSLLPDGIGTYSWNEDAYLLTLKLENPYTHLSINYNLHISDLNDDGKYTSMTIDNLYGTTNKKQKTLLEQSNKRHENFLKEVNINELDEQLCSVEATTNFIEFSPGRHYKMTVDFQNDTYLNGTYEGTWEYVYCEDNENGIIYGLLFREANIFQRVLISDGKLQFWGTFGLTNADQSKLLDFYIP